MTSPEAGGATRAPSSMSTWTRSTSASNCAVAPTWSASRWSSVAPGNRGVIAAASYEARRFGVFSAMPSSTARRMCPHAVFLPGDHELYGSVSAEVHEIFHSVTPFVEPLALDEAFLDVTGAVRLFGDGVDDRQPPARRGVGASCELRCSVGVAPNKFLAKLASKAAKPVPRPDGVVDGPGVVRGTTGRGAGVPAPAAGEGAVGCRPGHPRAPAPGSACAPSAISPNSTRRTLVSAVGKAHGHHLYELSLGPRRSPGRGRPGDEVASVTRRRSPTTATPTTSCAASWCASSDAVAARLRKHGTGARTLALKVRFAGFDTITRSVTAAVAGAHRARHRPGRRAAAAGRRPVARRPSAGGQRQQLRRARRAVVARRPVQRRLGRRAGRRRGSGRPRRRPSTPSGRGSGRPPSAPPAPSTVVACAWSAKVRSSGVPTRNQAESVPRPRCVVVRILR